MAKAAKEKTGESRTESGKKEGPQNTADNKEANMAKRARKKQENLGQNQGTQILSGDVLPVLLRLPQAPLVI